MKDLVFKGTFGYTEWGHRDTTHLRWFTRRDIVEAMERNGWAVQRVSHPELNRSRQLDRLTRRPLDRVPRRPVVRARREARH